MPTSYAWQPLDADFDCVFDNAEGLIRGLTMLNATRGINLQNNFGCRFTIESLRGQFLKRVFEVEVANDTLVIIYIRVWPFWFNVDFVHAYTTANRDDYYFKRQDGLNAEYLFSIFSRAMLRYGRSTLQGTGVSSEHVLKNVYADGCRHLLLVDADAAFTNLTILKAVHLQDNYGAGANYSIENPAQKTKVTIADLKANGLRGGFAYLDGADSVLSIVDFNPGTDNRCGSTTAFVAINGAAIRIANNHRPNAVSTIYGTNPVPGIPFTPPNNNGARGAGNVEITLDAGLISAVTDANGLITFPHNAGQTPTDVLIKPIPVLAAVYIVSADAKFIIVRCLNNIGGVIGAGVTVQLAYRLGLAPTSLPSTSYS